MEKKFQPGTTCHNSGGQNVTFALPMVYFMPAAEMTEEGLNPLPSRGLPVRPIICQDCGYVHLLLAKDMTDQPDSKD